MFAFIMAIAPPCWRHSDPRHNDDDCHNLKCLCHFTWLIWYIACWTIILKCKVSEKLIQHGNQWCSFQGWFSRANPSIMGNWDAIALYKCYECIDHSRYVWVVFLVDMIWINIEWIRCVSTRNKAGTVVKYYFGLWQHIHQIAKVPYQARILMKLCRCILETYNCMVDALDR